MNILIIGGNRFFGKRLVSRLINNGDDVTLLNRGNLDDGFGKRVKRIKCDRNNLERMIELMQDKKWDIVYDQVCFDYNEAKQACHLFKNKTKKYIFISSQSVYEDAPNIKEEVFVPKDFQVTELKSKSEDYAEAKRQAEKAFSEYANFPVTSVRFPIVIGEDDYTERFLFYIRKIKNKEPIYLGNPDARISFISSDFASKVLEFLGKTSFSDSINAASSEPIQLKSLIRLIEERIGHQAIYTKEKREGDSSPYNLDSDWYMNCDKLKKLGLEGESITKWIPEILDRMMEKKLL